MLSNPIIIFFKRFVSIRLLLSVLIIADGFLIINPILNTYTAYIDWRASGFTEWLKSLGIMKLLDIPRFILGISLIFLSFFMLTGARVAWLFAAFLLAIMTFLDLRVAQEHIAQGWFSLALFISLGIFWKKYPHHSLTSAGFVAVICIVALLIYSIFGTLYIGTEFSPNIKDVPTALYFALVCMTTVGFGDIVPISVDARMFTVTVIIFGITIFTTSVVYVVGVVAKGTQEIVRKRLSHMKDHYVVIGSTPLAIHLYNGLKQRGLPVAVLCREEYRRDFPEKDNIITGDPSNTDILNAAYIKTAKSILIMTDNDALNTFTFLATKELALPTAKIMVMVNQDDNMDKIRRLHPDMMFSLSSLSAQILMKMLCGETITNSVIDDFLINNVVEK